MPLPIPSILHTSPGLCPLAASAWIAAIFSTGRLGRPPYDHAPAQWSVTPWFQQSSAVQIRQALRTHGHQVPGRSAGFNALCGALKAHVGGFQLPISLTYIYIYIHILVSSGAPPATPPSNPLQCVQNFSKYVYTYLSTCIYSVSRSVLSQPSV